MTTKQTAVSALALGIAVLAIVGGFVYSTNRLSQAIHAAENASPVVAPQPDPAAVAALEAQRAASLRLTLAQAEEAEARAKAQRAIAESLRKPAPVSITSKPVPVTLPAQAYPGKPGTAKVYENPPSDTGGPRVVIEFSPEAASSIDYQAAILSGRCESVFSYVNPQGRRMNRLSCPEVVAR